MMKTVLITIVILLVPVLLIGCNPAAPSSPTPEPTSEPAGMELGETFSAQENGQTYSFDYPAGWAAAGVSGQIVVANAQETLDLLAGTAIEEVALPENSYGMQIQVLPGDGLPPEAGTPLGMLSLMTQAGAEAGAATFGTPEEVELNGNPAAKVDMTLAEASGEIYSLRIGETALLVIAASPEYAEHEATTEAILQTFNVQ